MTPEPSILGMALRRLWARWRRGNGKRIAPRSRQPDGPQDASASADPSVMPASWVPPAEADQTVIDCFRLAPYAPVRTDPVLSVREFYARHAAPSPWRLAGWSL